MTDNEKQIIDEFESNIYNRGFEDGRRATIVYDDGYKKGLNDAWEAAKKICKLTGKEVETLFPNSREIVLFDYTPSEAIKILEEYKKKSILNIYDEVIIRSKGSFYENDKAIVLDVDNDDITVLLPDRKTGLYKVNALEITGKSFPNLPELFEYLKGDK